MREIFPNIYPIDVVRAYCTTVRLSADPDELAAASNVYMSLMQEERPYMIQREVHTNQLIDAVQSAGPESPLTQIWRANALLHVTRSCVQGNVWAEDEMRDVFGVVAPHLEGLWSPMGTITSGVARRMMMREVASTMQWGGNTKRIFAALSMLTPVHANLKP